MNDQAARAWASIANSRNNLAHSSTRIERSRQILSRPGNLFPRSLADLTDVQRGDLLEEQEAYLEQREIEREVALSLGRQRTDGVA